jgi:hypothetical protein
MLGSLPLPSPTYLLSRTPTPKRELRNPFEFAFTQKVKKTPPRGANKRRRSETDSDDEDKENSGFSTPKRQRRVPLAMPLGLTAHDFKSLEPPSLSHSPISLPDASPPPPATGREYPDSAYGSSSPSSSKEDTDAMAWTIDDDRVLVETVLEKLQLSKRAWNDCARRLGKDKDSLGRRWRLLVDEGEVGLKKLKVGRRGGRERRVGLDVGSW